MAKPPLPLIVKWRDLAQEGRFYTDIAKDFPDYTASLEVAPDGGHLFSYGKGVHDAKNETTVFAGVPAADGRVGQDRSMN